MPDEYSRRGFEPDDVADEAGRRLRRPDEGEDTEAHAVMAGPEQRSDEAPEGEEGAEGRR